ncbi:hypothetical protein DVX06_07345 [Enterococcus faecium]|nr:hypothetical protein DVX06_07345 [Enterococcus faecium]
MWLKTLYRKRAVTWPFIFYTIIWTLSKNTYLSPKLMQLLLLLLFSYPHLTFFCYDVGVYHTFHFFSHKVFLNFS